MAEESSQNAKKIHLFDMRFSKSRFLTNYCVGWVGQSNFRWKCIIYSKQFF